VWREPFGAFFSWLGHLIGFKFDVSVVPLLTLCLLKFGSLSCFKLNKNGLQCEIFMDFCLLDNWGGSLGHSIGVKIAVNYLFLLSFAKHFPLGRQQPQNIVFEACIVHRFTMNQAATIICIFELLTLFVKVLIDHCFLTAVIDDASMVLLADKHNAAKAMVLIDLQIRSLTSPEAPSLEKQALKTCLVPCVSNIFIIFL